MHDALGKLLLLSGALMVVGGLVFLALGRFGVPRLPGDIHVQREEAQTLLKPVAEQLGIRLKLVPQLPTFNAMRSSLAEYMGGGF